VAKRKLAGSPLIAEQILDAPESTVIDLLDHLLNKGAMLTGDLTIGVAGIDLIYLRLSALLCAADRVLPVEPARRRRATGRRPRRLRV
jgi:hypothetical protein